MKHPDKDKSSQAAFRSERRRLIKLLAGTPLLALAACQVPRVAQGQKQALRMTLTGQVLMKHSLCADPYPGFNEVVAELRRGSVVFTDLEVAIKTPASGTPTRDNIFLHATSPAVLDCLRYMGFNLLALSNNHAWDLDTAGVLATRDAVAAAGFGFAGTGADLAAASAPGFVGSNPRVALVAMASGKLHDGAAATDSRAGVNELRMPEYGKLDEADVARNLASIEYASRTSDYVVAYLHNHHWGEDMRSTKPWARKFAQRCADAGADVFVSHGAPLLHGIEIYRGKALLHGLGSLVFHSRTDIGHYIPEVWQSAVIHLNFNAGALAGLEVVPISLNEAGDDPARHLETRGRPRIAESAEGAEILARLARASAEMGTTLKIAGNRATLVNA